MIRISFWFAKSTPSMVEKVGENENVAGRSNSKRTSVRGIEGNLFSLLKLPVNLEPPRVYESARRQS